MKIFALAALIVADHPVRRVQNAGGLRLPAVHGKSGFIAGGAAFDIFGKDRLYAGISRDRPGSGQ